MSQVKEKFLEVQEPFFKKGSATPTHSRSDRCRSFGGVISKVYRKNKVSKGISKKFLAAGGKVTKKYKESGRKK